MSAKKVRLVTSLRLNSYSILAEAVEKGLQFGWTRSHKHTNTPDKQTIIEQMQNEVMNALCEVLDFESDE